MEVRKTYSRKRSSPRDLTLGVEEKSWTVGLHEQSMAGSEECGGGGEPSLCTAGMTAERQTEDVLKFDS